MFHDEDKYLMRYTKEALAEKGYIPKYDATFDMYRYFLATTKDEKLTEAIVKVYNYMIDNRWHFDKFDRIDENEKLYLDKFVTHSENIICNELNMLPYLFYTVRTILIDIGLLISYTFSSKKDKYVNVYIVTNKPLSQYDIDSFKVLQLKFYENYYRLLG